MVGSASNAIFVSYAHKDNAGDSASEKWLDKLNLHLKALQLDETKGFWSDENLKAGDDWDAKIREAINDCDVAVLLVSAAYLASDYVRRVELPLLLDRAHKQEITLIPILLSICSFEDTTYRFPDPEKGEHETTLAKYQVPKEVAEPLKPLSEMDSTDIDRTLLTVARRLKEIVQQRSKSVPASESAKQELKRATVRFGKAGSGLLVSSDYVVTTASVVWDAMDGKRKKYTTPESLIGNKVKCNIFAAGKSKPRTTTVIGIELQAGRSDFALLRLSTSVPEASPNIRWIEPQKLETNRIASLGFVSKKRTTGQGSITGLIGTAQPGESLPIRILKTDLDPAQVEFRGAPIWDERHQAIIGLVGDNPPDSANRVVPLTNYQRLFQFQLGRVLQQALPPEELQSICQTKFSFVDGLQDPNLTQEQLALLLAEHCCNDSESGLEILLNSLTGDQESGDKDVKTRHALELIEFGINSRDQRPSRPAPQPTSPIVAPPSRRLAAPGIEIGATSLNVEVLADDLDEVSAEADEARRDYLNRLEGRITSDLKSKNRDNKSFVDECLELASADPGSSGPEPLNYAIVTGETDTKRDRQPTHLNLEEALFQEYMRVILLASPGSGKTSVLQQLALRLIGEYRSGRSKRLPIFVSLTEFRVEDLPRASEGRELNPLLLRRTIIEFLKRELSKFVDSDHYIAKNFEDLARQGRLVFILDGLDQMPQRRSQTARLENRRKVEQKMQRLMRWRPLLSMAGSVANLLTKPLSLFFRKQPLENYDASTVVSQMLVKSQESLARNLAPVIDPRERAIDQLGNLWPCPVIASCRERDFVGVPTWQPLEILPLNEKQITRFVTQYPNEVQSIILDLWKNDKSTRALISNPFYLRHLARYLVKRLGDTGSFSAQERQELLQRGKLLESATTHAIERELEKGNLDLNVDQVMTLLGALAYEMLQHNIIGGEFKQSEIAKVLGPQFDPILRIAESTDLIRVQEVPTLSIQFNHQLILEILLAFHLKKSQETGKFELALSLLSRQGDRWAEAVRLLYEMSSNEEQRHLIDCFVDAMKDHKTWDLATRVLSEIGQSAGPKVALLLEPGNDELTRRGAAEVLGRIHDKTYTDHLVSLSGDEDWAVRRAAVQALVAIEATDKLDRFLSDSHEMVLRSVYSGRLRHEEDPVQSVFDLLANPRSQHELQIAWAAFDLFPELLKRADDDALADLLSLLIKNKDDEIKVIGYLCVTRTPDQVLRRFKSLLLQDALNKNNDTINHLARSVVWPLLDHRDLQQVRKQTKNKDQKIAQRALVLMAETRQRKVSAQSVLSLDHANPNEINLYLRQLVRQGDSSSLSLVTYLLSIRRSREAALQALVFLGPKGVGHLLAALDDPLPNVRLAAAEILKFCHLPRKHGKKVREVLRHNKVRTHQVLHFAEAMHDAMLSAQRLKRRQDPDTPKVFSEFDPKTTTWASSFIRFFFGCIMWSAARFFGVQLPISHWIGYAHFSNPGMLETLPHKNIPIREIEKYAFAGAMQTPDTKFWLARAKFLLEMGQLSRASGVLYKCLADDDMCGAARFELALIMRKQSKLSTAIELLQQNDGRYLNTYGELLPLLLSLIETEHSQETGPHRDWKYVSNLIRLRLWQEAIEAISELTNNDSNSNPDNLYFLLYQCYHGLGQTRRALAAATINNNEKTATDLVPEVDITTLRWKHREEREEPEFAGELAIRIDLKQYDDAMSMLHKRGVLPSNGNKLKAKHADALYRFDLETRKEISQLLEETGNLRNFDEFNSLLSSTMKGLTRFASRDSRPA